MTAPTVVPAVEVYAGDSIQFPTYTFLDGETPRDLTAFTITASWRPNTASSRVLVLTVDDSAKASGTLIVSATAEQTREMASDGVWDMQAVSGSQVLTLLRGATRWVQDVTR